MYLHYSFIISIIKYTALISLHEIKHEIFKCKRPTLNSNIFCIFQYANFKVFQFWMDSWNDTFKYFWKGNHTMNDVQHEKKIKNPCGLLMVWGFCKKQTWLFFLFVLRRVLTCQIGSWQQCKLKQHLKSVNNKNRIK